MPPPCCMVSAASRRWLEDAAQVVGDVAHDEAVEQRHPAVRAGAGQDAPAGRNRKSCSAS